MQRTLFLILDENLKYLGYWHRSESVGSEIKIGKRRYVVVRNKSFGKGKILYCAERMDKCPKYVESAALSL